MDSVEYSPGFYCSIIMNNHVTRLGLAQITMCCELTTYGVTSLTQLLIVVLELERKPAAVHVKISTDFNML